MTSRSYIHKSIVSMNKYRVICRLFALASFLLAVPACATQATGFNQAELGAYVEFVLRNATCIKIVGTIHQVALKEGIELVSGTEPMMHISFMAKNLFKSEVFKKDKLVAAYSLVNGRIQEYCPLLQQQPIFEYEAMYVNGTGDVKFSNATDCLVVWSHLNWVGVSPDADLSINADPPQAFRFVVENGVRKADAVERGHDCYVFRTERQVFDGLIADVLYIDKQTSLVVRLDTFQPDVQRIRTYDITLLPEIPGKFEWRLIPPEQTAPCGQPVGVEWVIQVGK